MHAQDLIRGDRVWIDGRWRTVRRAETDSDGLEAVQTRWMSPRWSWTFAPHDDVPTWPRRDDGRRLRRLRVRLYAPVLLASIAGVAAVALVWHGFTPWVLAPLGVSLGCGVFTARTVVVIQREATEHARKAGV